MRKIADSNPNRGRHRTPRIGPHGGRHRSKEHTMRSTARSTRTTLAVFAITAVAMLGLAGCSSPGSSAEEEEPTMSEEATPTEEAMEADPAADLVGPGCAAYAEAVP
jgi:hypothetical protein